MTPPPTPPTPPPIEDVAIDVEDTPPALPRPFWDIRDDDDGFYETMKTETTTSAVDETTPFFQAQVSNDKLATAVNVTILVFFLLLILMLVGCGCYVW